jgi:hypothetical protein
MGCCGFFASSFLAETFEDKRKKRRGFKRLQNRFEIRFQKFDLLSEIIFKGLQTFLV